MIMSHVNVSTELNDMFSITHESVTETLHN